MNSMPKTKWLLPILLIGLAVATIQRPTAAPDQVLADGPPTTEGLEAQTEASGPLAVPPLAELLAEASVANGGETPGATAQLDTSTQGTY